MPSKSSAEQVEDLWNCVNSHVQANQGTYLESTVGATNILRHWLAHLRTSISTKTADRLLDAAQGTIIEVAGCLSLGLVRPALFSMRVQLELTLAWIFFNDHPVEWRFAEKRSENYPMRAEILRYFARNSNRFPERFNLLTKRKKRKNEDPYGILSVHVHSLSGLSAPSVAPL